MCVRYTSKSVRLTRFIFRLVRHHKATKHTHCIAQLNRNIVRAQNWWQWLVIFFFCYLFMFHSILLPFFLVICQCFVSSVWAHFMGKMVYPCPNTADNRPWLVWDNTHRHITHTHTAEMEIKNKEHMQRMARKKKRLLTADNILCVAH